MIDAICLVLGIFIIHLIYEYIIRKPILKDLDKKYILITGCDSGFGNALAKKLDGMGCGVFAACYTVEGADELRRECSPRLSTLHLDVSKEESIINAYDYVSDRLPNGAGLWGLVNNAGIGGVVHVPAKFHIRSDYQKVLDVNLLGMIDMCTIFLPLLKITKGRIVNMSSAAGRLCGSSNLPYIVSKWGVESFSDCLRTYYAQYGVHVSILEPGLFKTNMTHVDNLRQLAEAGLERFPQDYKDNVLKPNYISKFVKSISAHMGFASSDLSPVVNAYTHALLAAFPKKRYSTGYDAYLCFIPLSYFPSCITDFLNHLINRKLNKSFKQNS